MATATVRKIGFHDVFVPIRYEIFFPRLAAVPVSGAIVPRAISAKGAFRIDVLAGAFLFPAYFVFHTPPPSGSFSNSIFPASSAIKCFTAPGSFW